MNVPKELLEKVQELAKEVAKHKMAASISIAEDEGEEEEGIDVDEDDYEDDFDDDEGVHDNSLLFGIKNLLGNWEIRDTSSDAGRYYNELKQLYKENKDDV